MKFKLKNIVFLSFLCYFLCSCHYSTKTAHHLKKSREKEGIFIFDGETYTQEETTLPHYSGNCFIRYNSTIYDLSSLSNVGPFYIKAQGGSSIQFDICKNTISQCDAKIKGLVVSADRDKKKKCIQYSNTWIYDKTWDFKSAENFTLGFPEGEVCDKETNTNYKVNMVLTCNPQAKYLKITNDGLFNEKSCNNTIYAQSAEGKITEI